MSALLIALHSPEKLAELARQKVPYFVCLGMADESGKFFRKSHLVMVHRESDIDEVSLVPAGATLQTSEVFPLEKLHEMHRSQRDCYILEYRIYLSWRDAKRMGKELSDLQESDIDAAQHDREVREWLHPTRGNYGDGHVH